MCMRAKSLQSCPTPCDPMDCSPPGSSVHGILQARILQCVAMPSFRGSSQSRDRTYVSCVSCAGRQTLYHRVIAKSCPTLRPHGLQPARVPCPWDFPGKNAGVDCHFLLQGIFLTQETNPGLPHCGQKLYRLSHQGSPWKKKKKRFIEQVLGENTAGFIQRFIHSANIFVDTEQKNWWWVLGTHKLYDKDFW